MNSQPVEISHIRWLRVFPWLHLTRAFWIAADPRKLLLAATALVLLTLGEYALSHTPLAAGRSHGATGLSESESMLWPWKRPFPEAAQAVATGEAPLWSLAKTPIIAPQVKFTITVGRLLEFGNTWDDLAFLWTQLLWMLIVWAVFGGALTRMAGLDFARDQRIGPVAATLMSCRRFQSFVTAPLLGFVAIAVFWLLCALGGLIGRIPGLGELVLGMLWFVPLLLGALMTIILFVMVAGWPLMYATIAVEYSDMFDGFSRAANFVLSRPWHYVWNWTVSLIYGTVVVFVLSLGLSATFHLSAKAVGTFTGEDAVRAMATNGPQHALSGFRSATEVAGKRDVSTAGDFWFQAAALLLEGFCYFWSAATINYFLIRRTEDAIEIDEIHIPQEHTPPTSIPLAGIAATDHEAVERPVHPPRDSPDDPNDEGVGRRN